MVEDRITDGKRVAQLLASELTGLETGPLADVSVVDADPDVTPSPGGSDAYALEHRGTRVGSVSVYPDRARLYLDDASGVGDSAASEPIQVEPTDCGVSVWVENGVAVKRTVDVVRDVLARRD